MFCIRLTGKDTQKLRGCQAGGGKFLNFWGKEGDLHASGAPIQGAPDARGRVGMLLLEDVFELGEYALFLLFVGGEVGGAGHGLECLTLGVGELLGNVDHDVDELVAAG